MNVQECNSIRDLMRCWKNKPLIHTCYYEKELEIQLDIDHRNNFFISDGIVDEDKWRSVPDGKRILYIFKEAYEDDHLKAEWNLNDELREYGPWGSIWRRVCEWTYGILNTDMYSIPEYATLSHDQGNEYLRQVSVMNIKKSSGRHNSSYSEISAYAKADALEIIREIELIDPDIVICGATFGDINNITGNTVEKGSNDNWFYYSNAIGGKSRLFIDYYHPSNRYPALLNYYGVVGIYQQALKNNKGMMI